MQHIKLKQRVSEAVWDEHAAKWKVTIQDADTGFAYTDQSDILIQATGALNSWKWPNIEGLESFKGELLHSACWDENFEYKVIFPSTICPFPSTVSLTLPRTNESQSLEMDRAASRLFPRSFQR